MSSSIIDLVLTRSSNQFDN